MKRTMILPTLTLLTLFGCTREIDRNAMVRNSYRSREDCLRDWNTQPQDCQPVQGGGGFIGPWYPYYMYSQRFYGHSSPYTGFYEQGAGNTNAGFHSTSSLSESGGHVGTITRGGFGSTAFSSGS